jgi:carbohydrate binding protein with CBM4/9 domain
MEPVRSDQVRSTRPAPEVLGVMLAAIIYSVVGVGIIVASTVAPEVPTPTPTATEATVTPRPAPTMDASYVTLIRSAHAKIPPLGKELEVLLLDDPLVPRDVIQKVKEISAAATFAIGIVDRIAIQPGGAAVAPTLRLAYGAIVDATDKTLSVPFADRVALRLGAEGVVAAVAALPDINAVLILVSASASPSLPPTAPPLATPSESAGPTSTPEPTEAPTPKPTPSPTPTPTPEPSASVAPSPSPSRPSQLENGGFEVGVEPWTLVLAPGAAGTFERTVADHFAGSASAVVSVTGPVGPPSAVTVEQGGLTLSSGVTYTVSMAVRSTAARDIRVRLSTPTGQVIASRVLPVTSTWTTVSFEVTPIGGYQDVTMHIEAGASSQRIWLDALSLG